MVLGLGNFYRGGWPGVVEFWLAWLAGLSDRLQIFAQLGSLGI